MKMIGKPKIVMSNTDGDRNYFGWPTAARLRNGKIAVGASGFRLSHICPFGQSVMSVSDDEGETFSNPTAIINTKLDDRDAGLCPFSESGLIFTSFNNSVLFQKRFMCDLTSEQVAYAREYLDTVSSDEEARDLGANFRVSFDNGETFGPIYKAPITSPHGPTQLSDGSILWIGRLFSEENHTINEKDAIYSFAIDPMSGECELLGKIEPLYHNGKLLLSCEPHAIELSDGSIICHIRVQSDDKSDPIFTTYQCKSFDKGRTFTKPVQILDDFGGGPSHLFIHSSGKLIATYGCRKAPDYSIRAMISEDNGESWQTDIILYKNEMSDDLGYSSSVELKDGKILTVFYAHPGDKKNAEIMSVKWEI